MGAKLRRVSTFSIYYVNTDTFSGLNFLCWAINKCQECVTRFSSFKMASSIWKLDMFGTELPRSIMYKIQFIISYCCEYDMMRHLQGCSSLFIRCLFRLEVITKLLVTLMFSAIKKVFFCTYVRGLVRSKKTKLSDSNYSLSGPVHKIRRRR